MLTEELKKELKVPITLGYKSGAGVAVGVSSIIHAKPDGYSLLCTTNSSAINLPAMEKNPTFNPVTDLTPIALWAIPPTTLTSNSSSKLTSFDVMARVARENAGKLNCATSGIGTMAHFLIEYLKNRQIIITHVPTKGGSPAATSLLGNHVDLALTAYSAVSPHIKSGQLRLLAVTSKPKEEPEVPTTAEVGIPEATAFEVWYVFFDPPNLPKAILNRLSSAFEKAIQLPSVVDRLKHLGFIPTYKGPEASKQQIIGDYTIMKEIAQSAGMVK